MKKFKEKMEAIKNRFGYSVGLATVSSSIIVAPSISNASIPTEATSALTGYVTDATSFVADFWPLVIAVVIGFSFMSLFKQGVSKAT